MRDYFMFNGLSLVRFPETNDYLAENQQFDYFTHLETIASQYHAVWVGYVSNLYLQVRS